MKNNIERQLKYIQKQKEKNNKRVSFFVSDKVWKQFKKFQSNNSTNDFLNALLEIYSKYLSDLKEEEFSLNLKKEMDEDVQDFLDENEEFIGDPFFDTLKL